MLGFANPEEMNLVYSEFNGSMKVESGSRSTRIVIPETSLGYPSWVAICNPTSLFSFNCLPNYPLIGIVSLIIAIVHKARSKIKFYELTDKT